MHNRSLSHKPWKRLGLVVALAGVIGCAGPGLPEDTQAAVNQPGASDGGTSASTTTGGGGDDGTTGAANGNDSVGEGGLPPSDNPVDAGGFGPGPTTGGGGDSNGGGSFMIPDLSGIVGGGNDAGVPELTDAAPMAEGDLVISELIESPTGGTSHEWIELYNPTGKTFNLIGCKLTSKYGEHVIAKDLYSTAATYVVLGREDAASDGLVALYVYDDINLSSSSDDVSLACGTVTVDSIHYEGDLTKSDQSIQLSADKLDATSNDDASAWCLGTAKIGVSANQGTPGAVNSVCP